MRFVLVAAGLYLVFLPFWWYSLEPVTSLIGSITEVFYRLMNDNVSIAGNGRNINFFVRDASGQVLTSGLKVDTITYGLPMLAALILGTRSNSIMAKIRALIIGLLIMGAISVPAVMLWAKMTSLQLEEQLGLVSSRASGGRSGFFFYAFHGYAFSQPVIAVGIWLALISLGQLTHKEKDIKVERAPAATTLSRNAPCSCGSGLKYKRCCGAT